MKKIFTIGGAVLGTILAAALVIFIFFPGLPTYIIVKHKYDHIDELVPEFERSDIPADYVSHTLKGITFRTPSDWEGHSAVEGAEAGTYRSKDDSHIGVMLSSYKSYDDILGSVEDYDPWNTYEYEEEDYRHFLKAIGVEPPQYGFAYRILWYIRDHITAKDCIKLRGTDKKVFSELAAVKEESINTERLWKTEGNDFSAYIGQELYSSFKGGYWSITLYPNESDDEYYHVFIKCPDETTARQIISSIELE